MSFWSVKNHLIATLPVDSFRDMHYEMVNLVNTQSFLSSLVDLAAVKYGYSGVHAEFK